MNPINKKILIVSSGVPHINKDNYASGIVSCTDNLIKSLNSESYDIDVLYTAIEGLPKPEIIENFKNTMKCGFFTLHSYYKCKFYGKSNIQRSCRVLKWVLDNGLHYDKIIYHDFQGIGYYLTRAKKTGLIKNIDLLVNIHGNHCLSAYYGKKSMSDEDLFTFFMEKQSIIDADYVLSPSVYYLDWWSKSGYTDLSGVDKMVVNNFPFVCDDSLYNLDFSSVHQESSIKSVIKLGFIGRLEVLKGLYVICDAVKNLAKSYKVDIHFVGKSTTIDNRPSVDIIRELLNDKSITVKITHNKNTTDAIKIFKDEKRLVLHASLGETSSKVVEEMISNKVYVIASNLPGTKELIKPEFHDRLLFDRGSSVSLENKIIEFYKNPVLGELTFDYNSVKKLWTDILNKPNKETVCVINEYPKVSVIIPTKNRSNVLEKSIKSMLNQTYSNIEIIVTDDNSDDSEIDKVKEICQKLNVKLCLNTEPLFKGANCNNAVNLATGEFVLFFDDDDIAYDCMISKYIEAYHIQKYDVMSCFANVFETELNPLYESLSVGNCFEANIKDNMFGKGTFIIRKDKFDKVKYDVDSDKMTGVDYRFYIKASNAGLIIKTYPASLYFYRKNSANSLFYTATQELKDKLKLRLAELISDRYFEIDDFYLLPETVERYVFRGVKFMFKQNRSNKLIITFSDKMDSDDLETDALRIPNNGDYNVCREIVDGIVRKGSYETVEISPINCFINEMLN